MKQQGVTLIQLLLALALLGLLTQLGIPAYNNMSAGLQRQAVANDLAQALRSARSEALARNSTVRLEALESDWSKGWRMLLDEHDSAELLLERRNNGRTVIVGNRPVARQVRFSGLGVAVLESGGFQAGTLYVCQRPEALSQYRVVLSRSGRVSLRDDLIEQPLCAAAGSGQ
ncbi:GspH/FimT family protein [Pseudomonas sp. NUPR-001]|uniref:GspH/FimT family protein n=1 Tax=Pseudomonas sp. NUPR-001 TaxID=3416058 RepID=UPI003F98D27E